MKMNKLIILVAVICSITLLSCQSVKEGLSGKKKRGGDEFLVQKKNPLVKPENFDELPQPTQKKDDKVNEGEVDNIEDLFKIGDQELESENSEISALEKSILKKINED
jgi:hypothetical protein